LTCSDPIDDDDDDNDDDAAIGIGLIGDFSPSAIDITSS